MKKKPSEIENNILKSALKSAMEGADELSVSSIEVSKEEKCICGGKITLLAPTGIKVCRECGKPFEPKEELKYKEPNGNRGDSINAKDFFESKEEPASCPSGWSEPMSEWKEEPKCKCELDGFQGAISTQNCKIHNVKEEPMESWEETLEELLVKYGKEEWSDVYGGETRIDYIKIIKSFIHSEISKAVEQERDKYEKSIKFYMNEAVQNYQTEYEQKHLVSAVPPTKS